MHALVISILSVHNRSPIFPPSLNMVEPLMIQTDTAMQDIPLADNHHNYVIFLSILIKRAKPLPEL